jgi:predicted dehydrogenase
VDLSRGEDPLAAAAQLSRGKGVDAVIITASTKSSEPVSQAARMCRKRGRIVLVGVTGLALSRADFYEKELSFQVSCSYGPGRYDPEYEDKGHDYPFGFVRWTEQRNMEAVLDLMARGALDVGPLISRRFPIDEAERAYEHLGADGSGLGILLEYPDRGEADRARKLERRVPLAAAGTATDGQPRVAFIGAGNYAGRVLMPAFRAAGARLQTVASSGGVSGVYFGRKHGFAETTTDSPSVFADASVDTVVVATRHDTHARFVLSALQAGKHVFVEKPLCLTLADLAKIEGAYAAAVDGHGSTPLLMVGFNRRFAPQVRKIKSLLDAVAAPKAFVVTVNAGAIPAGHWTQDPEVGGGRVIGEACHFVDLVRFLADAPIDGFRASYLGGEGTDARLRDTLSLTLSFADGSFGTIHYLANGSKSFPKERIEVFANGAVLQLDNFRRLRGFGWPGFKRMNLFRQDKGQSACAAAFLDAVRTGAPSPIPPDELFEVTRTTIAIAAAGRADGEAGEGTA